MFPAGGTWSQTRDLRWSLTIRAASIVGMRMAMAKKRRVRRPVQVNVTMLSTLPACAYVSRRGQRSSAVVMNGGNTSSSPSLANAYGSVIGTRRSSGIRWIPSQGAHVGPDEHDREPDERDREHDPRDVTAHREPVQQCRGEPEDDESEEQLDDASALDVAAPGKLGRLRPAFGLDEEEMIRHDPRLEVVAVRGHFVPARVLFRPRCIALSV